MCGRGIDIDGVSLVVNIDFPFTIDDVTRRGGPDFDMYYHRAGRTGRLGKATVGRKGCCVTLISDDRDYHSMLKAQVRSVDTTWRLLSVTPQTILSFTFLSYDEVFSLVAIALST